MTIIWILLAYCAGYTVGRVGIVAIWDWIANKFRYLRGQ